MGSRCITTLPLTSALNRFEWSTPRPYCYAPWELHCTEGWVGPRVGRDGCEKSRPPLGIDPRNVQPVASRCTDVIPAHSPIILLFSLVGLLPTYAITLTFHTEICVSNSSVIILKNRFMQFICLAVAFGRQWNVDLSENVSVHSVTI